MKTAIEICKTLNKANFEAYIVGGWVRDNILSIESSDIDIATDATPEEVTKLFKSDHINIIPTGIDHGTVTIIHEQLNPRIGYELTTYRRDISTDGRNATVEFAKTIEEDLSRRDFTMNAIAYDPIDDIYVDPYGGVLDIHNKIIRCVGDPNERFKEDYLRMLRALRFRATLNFEIVPDIYMAINTNAHLIKKISSERIKMEIDKCFEKSKFPSAIFRQGMELFHHIIPELSECMEFLQNKHHAYDVFYHTMNALDAVPKEHPLIRWAVLFHDLGKPESCKDYGTSHASFHAHEIISERIAKDIMARLKFSNKDMEYILNLVRNHMFCGSKEMKDSAVRRFVSKIGPENVDAMCILKYADRVGNGTKPVSELNIDNTFLKSRFEKILKEENAFKIKDLAINGHDIMEILNIPGGKKVGDILKDLFEQVMEDPTLNNRETLIVMVKEIENG